jgi:hypothetical protein
MPAARLPRVVVALALLGAGCGAKPIADPASIIALFMTGTQAADRSMHIEASGRITTPMFETTFSSVYDFQGADFRGVAKLETPGLGDLGRYESDVIRVANVGFSRFGNRDWTIGGGLPLDPFAGIDPTTVSARETEIHDGRSSLHLAITSPEAFAGALGLTTNQAVQGATAVTGTYDVVVDDRGIPLSARATVEGSLTGEMSGPFTATVIFAVNGWGTGASVTAPFPVNTFPPGTTFVADNGTAAVLTWHDAAGHVLVVQPCSRASSTTFDGRSFIVTNAAGVVVDRTEPDSTSAWQWGFEGSDGNGEGGGLPYTATMAPCAGAAP